MLAPDMFVVMLIAHGQFQLELQKYNFKYGVQEQPAEQHNVVEELLMVKMDHLLPLL